MRGKDKKIEPPEDLRTASGRSPFGERLIVVALCGMVCSVPLVYLPGIFEYALLPRLFALHLCVALASLGWLIQTRWGRNVRNESPATPNGSSVTKGWGIRCLTSSPLFLPALCLMAVGVLSSPFTTHPLDTAVELLNQAALLGLFFVAASTLTPRSALPVLWASAVAGLTVAAIGILQYHGLAFLNIPSAALPSATFGNRNFAAMYLVCAAPLSGLLFLVARRQASAILAGLSTTLMGVFLVYTRTRSAWVGVAFAWGCAGGWLMARPGLRRPVWEAVRSYADRPRRRMALGFCALFLVLSALPAHRSGLPESKTAVITTAASIFQKGTVEEVGMKYRLAAWSGALRLTADHPLLGVGPGGWVRAYPPYDRGVLSLANSYMNNPHNDYLWIAAEYGLIGLGVYLWFLTAGFRSLLATARRPETFPRVAALTFALSLLSTLGDAFFNFPREQPQAAMFLYLLFGIAASATAGQEKSERESGRVGEWEKKTTKGRAREGENGRRISLPFSLSPILPFGRGGRVRSVCRLLPYLLLTVSLTALELDRRRIGFDRHYLRAMSSAALPGEGQAVLSEVQRALEYGTFQPHILNLKGNALKNLRRYEDAEAAYRQALVYAPHSWHAHNGLCAVALQKGRLEEALAHGQAALSLCPRYAEARNNLGSALAKKGDLDGAIREYREAIHIHPDFAEAHNNLGSALKARGDLDGAVEACRRALRIQPDLVEARYNLGGILKARGDLDGAIREYREAIRIHPGFAEAHYNLGLVLKAKGNLDGAIREYREAIRIKPGFPEAHNNLGSALARKGDLDGAIREYREAIQIKPDFPEARHNLDLLLKAKKDRTDAREAF